MVFCFNCGTQLPDAAKFCSSCGTQLTGSPAPAPNPSPVSPIASSVGSPPIYSDRSSIPSTPPVGIASTPNLGAYTPPIQASGGQLLNAIGQPTQAFTNLAAALFNALDASVEVSPDSSASKSCSITSKSLQPKNSHGMEVSKMTVYRQASNQPIPPYFGEAVLPTYCRCSSTL